MKMLEAECITAVLENEDEEKNKTRFSDRNEQTQYTTCERNTENENMK
jgi:hypothetical protein